jgi:hypothetical protein
MAKFELTKTIEAVRLNKRTLRPLGPEMFTLPYGGILENMTEDRDRRKFFYLGEPYECPESVIASAIRELK